MYFRYHAARSSFLQVIRRVSKLLETKTKKGRSVQRGVLTSHNQNLVPRDGQVFQFMFSFWTGVVILLMGILKHHLNMDPLVGRERSQSCRAFSLPPPTSMSATRDTSVWWSTVWLGGGGGAVVVSCLQHVQGAGSSTGCETKGVLCCRILHVFGYFATVSEKARLHRC